MLRVLKTTNFQLACISALVISISIAALGLIFFFSIRNSLVEQLKAHIEGETEELLVDYRDDGIQELRHDIKESIKLNRPERLLYFLENNKGRIIFDSIDKIPRPFGWHQITIPSGNKTRELLLYSLALEDGYTLAIAADLASIKNLEKTVFQSIGWLIILTIPIGIGGGLLLSSRFLRRVDNVIKSAERIGSDNLSERIQYTGAGDDFDQLAQTINRMLDRIEHLVGSVKRVSTNIAHDLRTPLSHLKQLLEQLSNSNIVQDNRESLVTAAIEKVDEILEIFSALLRIVELESREQRKAFVQVNLSSLLQQLLETYQPVFEDHKKTVSSSIEPSISIPGDKHLLTQLFANVIENAIQHTQPGAKISVTAFKTDRSITVAVSDNGPGVAEIHKEDVFKPFFKLTSNHKTDSGTGLGLSIVSAIADLHNLKIHLKDNHPGLTVTLEHPCKDSEPY